MPSGVVSGAKILNGFLLVAFYVEGHALDISDGGAWTLDGRSVELFTPLTKAVA